MPLKQDKMSEFKISKEIKNPLFGRTEIEMLIELDSTPTKKQVIDFLSKKFSSSENCIYVESIKGKFGSPQFKIIARVYSSEEEKNSVEIKSKKQAQEKPKEPEGESK